MSEPIFYVDRSEIREGKLEALEAAIRELVAFVEANEPQLASYGFYFDARRTRMTVVAVHPDTASMEFHMQVAGPAFRGFRDLIDLKSIDIYGPLDARLLDRLREKAQMLGHGVVTAHRLQGGFAHFASR